MFGVQLYKNNARALLSRILNLDWLQHARSVRGVYECLTSSLCWWILTYLVKIIRWFVTDGVTSLGLKWYWHCVYNFKQNVYFPSQHHLWVYNSDVVYGVTTLQACELFRKFTHIQMLYLPQLKLNQLKGVLWFLLRVLSQTSTHVKLIMYGSKFGSNLI